MHWHSCWRLGFYDGGVAVVVYGDDAGSGAAADTEKNGRRRKEEWGAKIMRGADANDGKPDAKQTAVKKKEESSDSSSSSESSDSDSKDEKERRRRFQRIDGGLLHGRGVQ